VAKLKIPKNVPVSATHPDGFDHDTPNEQGYVNVTRNLILNENNYVKFLLADPDERPEMLQGHAGHDEAGRPCFVMHQEAGAGAGFVKIDDNNCVIKGERDRRKRRNTNKPSRYTIPIPDARPQNVNYLDKYAYIIFELYRDGYGYTKNPNEQIVDQAKLDRAHEFIFGMMLLTRCR
jgi:hypothetical protein